MLLTTFNINSIIAFDKQVYKRITILLPLYKENVGSYLSAVLGQYGIRNQQFVSVVLRSFYNLVYDDNVDDLDVDYNFLEVLCDFSDQDINEDTSNLIESNLPDIDFDDKKPLSELNIIVPCFILLKKTGAFCVYIKQLFGGHLFKFFVKQKIKRRRTFSFIRRDWRILDKYGYYSDWFHKMIIYYLIRFRRRYYLNFLALYKIFIFKDTSLNGADVSMQNFYKKLRLAFYNKWI